MAAVHLLRRLAASLTGNLVVWLLLAAGAGLLLPGAAAPLRRTTPVILAVMIAGLGVGVPPRELVAGVRRPAVVVTGLLAPLAIAPLVAVGLWQALGPEPVALGLVVQAMAPAEITSPLMVRLSGGRAGSALPVLAASLLVAPVTMPLLVAAVVGRTVPVPAGDMLQSLLLTVATPLVAGSTLAARTRRPRLLRDLGAGVSAAMVVLLVLAVTGGATVGGLPPVRLVVAAGGAVLLLVAGFAAGWAAGALIRRERRTLLFTTGMREFGVATAVSLSFLGAEAAISPAVYGVLMMVGAAWLTRHLAS